LPVDSDMLRLIKPSDRVDILVTFEAVMADGHKERVTATILQNILVLGVGSDLGQGRTSDEEKARAAAEAAQGQFSDKGVLSLALNPAEAQYLALSIKQGDVTTVLRGLGDVEMHPIEMASFQKLFR
jgi:pilus assembly protein CpaB